MALTPINYVVNIDDPQAPINLTPTPQTSKTWRLDLENGRIGGYIDGKEAIRQYISKALTTARNRYLIYNDAYGEEISDFIGQNLTQSLLDVEIPRLVREAIQYDDRISEVSDIRVSQYNSDSTLITFTVKLINGEFLTEEVTL